MTKDEKKSSDKERSSTYVHTFRSDIDKSVGVSVWLADAPGGGPAYLYYEQSRSYESKQTKQLAYSRKFFSRNSGGHVAAIAQAAAFMEAHASNPEGAIEAAQQLKAGRSQRVNGESANPA